jgi:hypothetical protein
LFLYSLAPFFPSIFLWKVPLKNSFNFPLKSSFGLSSGKPLGKLLWKTPLENSSEVPCCVRKLYTTLPPLEIFF